MKVIEQWRSTPRYTRWRRKQVSAKVKWCHSAPLPGASHLSPISTSTALAAPSPWGPPLRPLSPGYQGGGETKLDHNTLQELKLVGIPIVFWIKHRCLSDLISYHVCLSHDSPTWLIDILCPCSSPAASPLHSVGLPPGALFPPDWTRLVPSSNQGPILSRIACRLFFTTLSGFISFHKSLIIWNYVYLFTGSLSFFPTRMETLRSETYLPCSLLHWQHLDIDNNIMPSSKSRFQMASYFGSRFVIGTVWGQG